MSGHKLDHESFRDTITTVDEQGKRVWIYPAKPKGRLHNARRLVALVLLAFMFLAPFIKVKGHPLLLFNVVERKFILFGQIFWPQDFYLFVLATIIFIVFIVLFTVVFGRLWCGWACPQTVFMEMVFRKMEYWIEGNSGRQRALDKAPRNGEKLLKKISKHIIFFAISFVVGNTFLAYIVGVDRLQGLITDGPGAHPATFIATLAFSLITYGVFARFREQVCIIVCPYGRLQSVLLDGNSIVVAYDLKRGEPRGPMEPRKPRGDLGHCVDCGNCVKVCPTGIDIRNGTQLECINCTACIDACNQVMDRVRFPRGLIRYASHKGISQGTRLRVTPRMVGYSAVLIGLIAVLTLMLTGRSDLQATILRTPGVMFEELPNGKVRNLYSFKVINKTFSSMPIELRLEDKRGEIAMVGGNVELPAEGVAETAFFIDIPKDSLISSQTELTVRVYGSKTLMTEIKTKFLGPRVGVTGGSR